MTGSAPWHLTSICVGANTPGPRADRERVQGCPAIAALETERGLNSVVSDASARSEEHTSELQSLMRISYAVFCLIKKNNLDRKREHIAGAKDQHHILQQPCGKLNYEDTNRAS